MTFVQTALLMLLLTWVMQIAASWIQWKHYRQAMNATAGRWSDGYLGSGRARSRLWKGAVALLTVSPDLRVRQLQTMKGMSVFARFEPQAAVQGWTLAELASHYAVGVRDSAEAKAIRQAISQVEEVRRRQP